MASLPRKKIATYGKSVRRRIPEQSFARFRQSQSPEKKSAPFPSRSPSAAPLEPIRLKSPKKRPSPSAVPALKANVFDVPSSDDEFATPTAPRARKPAPKATTKHKVLKATGSKVAASVEEVGKRKRIKLSPAAMEVEKTVVVKLSSKPTLPPSKALHKSTELGHTKVLASRLKTTSMLNRKPESLRTPEKLSVSPTDDISYQTLPPHTNVDAMDVDAPNRHISPRGQQIWKEVLNSVDNVITGGQALQSTVSNHTEKSILAAPSTSLYRLRPQVCTKTNIRNSLV